MKKILLLTIALIFSGCIPKSPHTLNIYDLDVEVIKTSKKKINKVLLVKYPRALGAIAGSKIYYKKGDLTSYYLYSNWSSSLNRMLYKDLLKAMQNSKYKSVVGYDSQADANLALESEILDFYHIVNKNNSYAKITINVKLINLKNNQIVKSKTYTYHKEIPTANAKNFVISAKEALREFLYDVSRNF